MARSQGKASHLCSPCGFRNRSIHLKWYNQHCPSTSMASSHWYACFIMYPLEGDLHCKQLPLGWRRNILSVLSRAVLFVWVIRWIYIKQMLKTFLTHINYPQTAHSSFKNLAVLQSVPLNFKKKCRKYTLWCLSVPFNPEGRMSSHCHCRVTQYFMAWQSSKKMKSYFNAVFSG